MKLETFFDKFAHFSDTPDAIARMRELVLELAVSGKLISQNPADDSASNLLRNVRAQRFEFVSGRKIKARILEEIRAGDHPFDLPSSWRWARLGDVGYELGQKVPNRRFTYIDVGSIDSRRGCVGDDVQALEAKEAPSRARKLVAQGTVVYSTIRPYLLNIAVIDHELDPEPIASTAFGILHPFAGINSRFLFYWLRSPLFTAYVEGEMKGMAYPAINDEKFYAGYVPVPPSAEQKRIVAKVDELMALCDRLEAQQKERETQRALLTHAAISRFDEAPTPANLNFLFHPSYCVTPAELRKTILNLAAGGRLVQQNLADDQAAALLAQVNTDRESRASEEGLRLPKNIPPLSPDDYPHSIPESWQWERIGKIALRIDYGTSQRADDDPSNVPVYRMGNIAGGHLSDANLKYVRASIGDLPALYLEPDDILFNRTNSYELVGKTAIFKGPPNAATFASYLIRVRLPGSLLYPDFFNVVMNAPYFRQTQIEPEITQQCGQANFNGTKLSLTAVPVPPLSEQRRIVARVNQLMGLVDQLEAQLAASEKTAKELLDAVVSELLRPTADVIEFPSSESDRASQRAAIGCYAVDRLTRNPSFGRVMLMKACYLAETHLGIPLGWQPMRQAAGPWDPWVQDFESLGTRSDWFAVTEKSLKNGHIKLEYTPKKALKNKAEDAITILGNQKAAFDRLLDLFADKNTEEVEIITTLFAAWNDFLIDGKIPTDDEVIHEVRDNWHQSKKRFTPVLLQRWLRWMSSHDLIPKGHGPRTRQQLTLELN